MASIYLAFKDLVKSLQAWRLWSLLGWIEIRQRYARSSLGPFWLTISMGVLICTFGVVYGALFGQPLADYLPMVGCGLVIWTFFSTSVSEGSQAYISSVNFIRQVRTTRYIYVLQVLWRNSVIFAHNIIIIMIMIVFFGVKSWLALICFFPGFLLLVINAFWIGALTGLLSARFRDFPQIVAALLQVSFYATPILFKGDMLQGEHYWIVQYNPLAYLIDVVRQPLTGEVPDMIAWIVCSTMALLGGCLTLYMTGRYYNRIPYWV
jgi:lipopolysaccharide transport system permease protein